MALPAAWRAAAGCGDRATRSIRPACTRKKPFLFPYTLPHLSITERERSPGGGLGLAWGGTAVPRQAGRRREKLSSVQVGFESRSGPDSRRRMKLQEDGGTQGASGPTPQHWLLATTDGEPDGVLSSLPPGQAAEQPHQLHPGKALGTDPPVVMANGHPKEARIHERDMAFVCSDCIQESAPCLHSLCWKKRDTGPQGGGNMKEKTCARGGLCTEACRRKRRRWRCDLPRKGVRVSSKPAASGRFGNLWAKAPRQTQQRTSSLTKKLDTGRKP